MRMRALFCVASSMFLVAAAAIPPACAESPMTLQAGGQNHAKKKRGQAEGEILRPVQPGTSENNGSAATAPNRRPAPAPRDGDCAKCVFF